MSKHHETAPAIITKALAIPAYYLPVLSALVNKMLKHFFSLFIGLIKALVSLINVHKSQHIQKQ